MAQPPEIPVRDYPSPEIFDGLVVEVLDNNKQSDWKAYPVGYRMDEQADSAYAGYELVAQKTTGDFRWTQRFWCNPAVNQNLYNASVSFDGDDITKPIYTRTYVERRPFVPRTRAEPLKVVLGATVTNGGSNYLSGGTGFLDVVLSGGGGSGATAQAIVYRGVVVFIRITNEGTGYTSNPSVVFPSGSATAGAYISSQSALLVKEEQGKLQRDDPRYGLYDLVVRTYHTLPGAVVKVSEKLDTTSGGNITVTKQKKLESDITVGTVITPGVSVVETSIENIEGSDVMAYEVTKTYLKGPWYSKATAKITYKSTPKEFPGYLLSIDEYIMVVDLYGTAVGHRKASADNAVAIIREWWVIDNDIPEVVYGTATGEDVHVDQIVPGDIVVNGVPYRHVLHDDAIRDYGDPLLVPETTPSASEYYGTVTISSDPFAPGTPPKWIGTEKTTDAEIDYYGIMTDGVFSIKTISYIMQ